ncbi:uncharacterized protein LOC100877453 isoform X2 [Megachile rotundata]|uniref:uncharacterized protein LOC100877453 isoform X2 n=1 Tax=Megachile rotundata TaxID=143995 RepID=UPI000614CD51|nr:PREDICTED: uncharacterized protein LOC100877453 isoform X2 [Megachile rotundata]
MDTFNNYTGVLYYCDTNIRRPLVTRLCREKMFTSGTNISKKAEFEFKTISVPDKPSTCTDELRVKENKDLVLANHRLTIEDHVDTANISFGSTETILKDVPQTLQFHMGRYCAAHTALVLREHFTKKWTHIVPQPPYSSDSEPCDFWLFNKLKRPCLGHGFESTDEIKVKSTKVLEAITEKDLFDCFENWKKRWHKSIIFLDGIKGFISRCGSHNRYQ